MHRSERQPWRRLDMMRGMERDGLRVTSTLLVVQMDRWWCQLLGEGSARGLGQKKKILNSGKSSLVNLYGWRDVSCYHLLIKKN